jgi:putative oxidoreductase
MANESSPAMFSATDQMASRSADLILLIARILLGWLFLTNGWMKLMNVAGATAYLASLHVPGPGFWVWPALLGELLIGVTLILGIATRYASLFTFVYLIIATAIAHRYWQYPVAQQGGQYAHFCKNLGLMGAALMLFWAGPGRYSVDARMR